MSNLLKRVSRVIYNTIIVAAPYIVPVLVLLAETGGDFPPAGF
jgi:hypothetical protein